MESGTPIWALDSLDTISQPLLCPRGQLGAETLMPSIVVFRRGARSTCYPPLGPADPSLTADRPENKGTMDPASAEASDLHPEPSKSRA